MAAHDTGFELDFEDFDAFEVELDAEFDTRYIKPPRTREIPENNLKYSDAQKLAKDITLKKNSRFFVVVNGGFYFGNFIEALVTEKKYKVVKMTISTLSMNENNIDSLYNLFHAGWLKELNLIISDYFFSHERHNLVRYLYQQLDKDNRFQLAVAGTHCKLCLMETLCGKFIVMHGSANLRSSGNIEQFVLEESKALYDFNLDYQERIVEQYKTIDKAVRGKELWLQVAQEGKVVTPGPGNSAPPN